jgi:acyl-CoA thioesterase I
MRVWIGGAVSRRGRECGYGLWRILVNVAIAMTMMAGAASASAAPVRIVALGDSLTAGFGVAPEDAFPVRLQAWLKAHGVDATVANAGVSGDTTAGGLARLDWALTKPADAILVELGANDALRALDPGVARKNLDGILTILEQRKMKVLLLGMKSLANWGADYATAFDAIYPELAEQHHVLLYPFFLDGVALQPALNQPDGMHPNARGVEVIVERVGPYVMRLLGATAAGNG